MTPFILTFERKTDAYIVSVFHSCFLPINYAFYFALVLLIGIILIFIAVIFVIVVNKIMCKQGASTKNNTNAVTRLRRAVAIIVHLSLTWIFGLLSLIPGSNLVFQYLFGIFISFQGFFIFVLLCLVPGEARKVLKGVICYRRSKKRDQEIPEDISSKSGLSGDTATKGLSDELTCAAPNDDTKFSDFSNPLPVTDAIAMTEPAKADSPKTSQQSPLPENPTDPMNPSHSNSDHETELNDKGPITLHEEEEEPTEIKIDKETEAIQMTTPVQVYAEVAEPIIRPGGDSTNELKHMPIIYCEVAEPIERPQNMIDESEAVKPKVPAPFQGYRERARPIKRHEP